MRSCTREITKEQYERIAQNGTYVSEEDKWIIFDASEIWGYGVYGARVYQSGDKYYVSYDIGSTCD